MSIWLEGLSGRGREANEGRHGPLVRWGQNLVRWGQVPVGPVLSLCVIRLLFEELFSETKAISGSASVGGPPCLFPLEMF